MTINQLIEELEKQKERLGGDTPVYTNGEPHIEEMEVSGVRFRKAETVDCDGEEIPLWADRVFLKV